MKHTEYILFILLGLVLFNSCKILYPNRMFKKGNYEYLQTVTDPIKEYVIQKGDQLTLQIYARNGFDLIDVLRFDLEAAGAAREGSGGMMMRGMQNQGQNQFYLVEPDGFVELPIFGRVYVEGFTEKQVEELIEKRSADIFIEPFAILRVINRRVFLFKGPNGSVVPLNPNPTNIIEVIAASGGLERNVKAYKIKVIRGDLKNPEIIDIDLSTIEGLKKADLIVQSNDIIYIEDRLRVTQGVLSEITPIVSLITTFFTLFILLNRI